MLKQQIGCSQTDVIPLVTEILNTITLRTYSLDGKSVNMSIILDVVVTYPYYSQAKRFVLRNDKQLWLYDLKFPRRLRSAKAPRPSSGIRWLDGE
jgi:hypothetical protein